MPVLRYLIYVFGATLCVGYFVWSEISYPGSLRLIVFDEDRGLLGTSEYSPLETIQPLMLATCAALYAWVAGRYSLQRPVAYLFGGIAVAGIIRELDFHLDRAVADNFWQVLVTVIAALLIVYTFRYRRRFGVAILKLWPSPALTLLFAGIVIEFVFAQLIGHDPFWRTLMGESYQRIVKLSIEEFIELIGYFLLMIGTIEYVIEVRATHSRSTDAPRRRSKRRSRRPRGSG